MSDESARTVAALLGRKVGMTQVYTEDGRLVPVTVVHAGPCTVIGERTTERDGYRAAQLGYEPVEDGRVSKPERGLFAKVGSGSFRTVREVAIDGAQAPALGTAIRAEEVFAAGDRVAVTGTTKGRGTAGVMKRHNFAGFPASHGTHEYFRHGGAIGNRSYPGRVFKGKRMPGRLGATRVTTPNLTVVKVHPEQNLVLLCGAIPGARGGLVMIRKLNGAGR